MKRFSFLFSVLLALFLASFLLVSCTGSTELGNQTNIIFVVAFQDKVGLVDKQTLIDSDATVQAGSLFTSTELSNASQAVAYDFSYRNNNFRRDELFLLSRDDTNQAYISVFDMTNANIENGDEALVLKRDVVEVTVGLARAEDVAAPNNLCVTDIQVSQTGQYVALLSNQRSCDSSSLESNAIDIIDLGEDLQSEPTLVYHKTLSMTLGENSQIFSDQNAERLFFLEGSGGQGILRNLSIPEFVENTVLQNVDITDVIGMQPFVQTNIEDEELILTRTQDYQVVTNYLDIATLEPLISYGQDNENFRQAFPTPKRDSFTNRFFALTASEFFVFDTPALENVISAPIIAVDGFYELQDEFVYLLTERNIRRYDSQSNFDVLRPQLDSFNVSELQDVQLFTWVSEVAATVVAAP